MFKAAVGHGIDPDSIGAISEALEQCQKTLDGDIPQAGILLAAIDFDHKEILKAIHQVYPDILLIGGTSIGEMSSEMAFQQDSLTLMLFASDEVSFSVGLGQDADINASKAAQQAIEQAVGSDQQAVRLCYALGEGVGIDAVDLVSGLRQATGHQVPVVGGLTTDDLAFENTYQFFGQAVYQNSLVVLTFSGALKVSYGVATGQSPIGRKATVTRSESFTVYEIDGQPAREFYAPYFGDDEIKVTGGSSLVGALAVFEGDSEEYYVRAPNGEDELNGGVNYFGHVPEQATIQITEISQESLMASAEVAIQKAQAAYPGEQPSAALLISCVSRMKNLGTQAEEEFKLTQSHLGKTLPSFGFYSNGEISPFTGESAPHFHNETLAAVLIGTR